MIENMSDIQKGMDVYGNDGEKIGSVDEVYSGSGSGTTRQAGSGGIGGLDVETVTHGDTTYRDPTAPGADYTNTTGTDTTYRDPTARGADYTDTTSPGSTHTDPTLPSAGGFADTRDVGGTGVRSDMGDPIGTSDFTGSGGTTSFSDTSRTTDYVGTGTSDFGSTGGTTDFTEMTGSGMSTSGIGTATATSTGYFTVKQGGLLGIGGTELSIPFSAVTNIVPGDNLTIDCTKDECASRYAQQPDTADNGETPLT